MKQRCVLNAVLTLLITLANANSVAHNYSYTNASCDACLLQAGVAGTILIRDCMAYMTSTVRQYPVIVISAMTRTTTLPPIHIAATSSVTSTVTGVVATEAVTVVTSASLTTTTVPATLTMTVTAHAELTTYFVSSPYVPAQRASVTPTRPSIQTDVALRRRATSDMIPTYATACTGTMYARACLCIGATAATTTLPRLTSTTFVTRVSSITETASPFTLLQTVFSTTFITRSKTVAHPSTVRLTSVQTVTALPNIVTVTTYSSTSTIPLFMQTPTCNSFYLQSTGPTRAGERLQYKHPFLGFGLGPPALFSVTYDGLLQTKDEYSNFRHAICVRDGVVPGVCEIDWNNPTYKDKPSHKEFFNFEPIFCNADHQELYCSYSDGSPAGFSVKLDKQGDTLGLAPNSDNGYPIIGLAIVPACGTNLAAN